MIVLVKTVETIAREFEVVVPDGTTAENVYSRVEETEEAREGWIEGELNGTEDISEITTPDGKVLWTRPLTAEDFFSKQPI